MGRIERRRDRLRQLVNEVGGNAELARRLDKAPAQISQMLNSRGIGNKVAEEIEHAMNKPDGWLDQWLPDEGGGDDKAMSLRSSDRSLISAYRALEPGVRLHLRHLIEALHVSSKPSYQKYVKEQKTQAKKRRVKGKV